MKTTFFFFLLTILNFTNINAQYRKLYDFSIPTGCCPQGSLIISGNKMYGFANSGGIDTLGIIFSIDTSGNNYKNLHSFTGPDGAHAYGTLTQIGRKLFGAAGLGGIKNSGTIFSIDTSGNNYKVLYDFDSVHGKQPMDKIIYGNGKFYGMTYFGGMNNYGVVFSIDTNGNNYKVLVYLSKANGVSTWSQLVLSGNNLYGLGYGGGTYGFGTLFSVDTNGNSFNVLYNFGDTIIHGRSPTSLIKYSTKLYGFTLSGGTTNLGVVFSIDTDGSDYKVLYDFTGATGNSPYSPLAIASNKIVGMAPGKTDGVLFSIDTSGNNYEDLVTFNGTNGGIVTLCGATILNNIIYGVTAKGGANNVGVIFSYGDTSLSTGVSELKTESEAVKVFPNPSKGIFQLKIENRELKMKNTVDVFNMLGQQVYSTPLNLPQGGDFKMDLSNKSTGIYLYRVISEKGELIGSGKLVIQ